MSQGSSLFLLTIFALASIALSMVPVQNAVPYVPAATINRETIGGSLGSLFGNLATMLPSMSSVFPMLLAVGVGALLVPLLGGALFFREGQKRGLPGVSPAILETVTDVMEKVINALDAVEKKY